MFTCGETGEGPHAFLQITLARTPLVRDSGMRRPDFLCLFCTSPHLIQMHSIKNGRFKSTNIDNFLLLLLFPKSVLFRRRRSQKFDKLCHKEYQQKLLTKSDDLSVQKSNWYMQVIVSSPFMVQMKSPI